MASTRGGIYLSAQPEIIMDIISMAEGFPVLGYQLDTGRNDWCAEQLLFWSDDLFPNPVGAYSAILDFVRSRYDHLGWMVALFLPENRSGSAEFRFEQSRSAKPGDFGYLSPALEWYGEFSDSY